MKKNSFTELWYSKDESLWKYYLKEYENRVKNSDQVELERKIEELTDETLKEFSPEEWYDFLLNIYFKWKYTQANRYKSLTNHLKKYKQENKLNELDAIKNEFLVADKTDIEKSLEILCKIHGLGPSGASGLLALLYPTLYGTVDQFVIKALKQIDEFRELKFVKLNDFTIDVTVFIIDILKRKAEALNGLFETDFWTPRKIDMVLWAYRD